MISPHVGGGFGSKWQPHADVILALFAAKHLAGRPVKFALTRQQMFSQVGYRTPTIQRVRLGTDTSGRLRRSPTTWSEQTAKIKEWAEQTTVPSGTMYARPAPSDLGPPGRAGRGAAERDAGSGRDPWHVRDRSRPWTRWRWPVDAIRSSFGSATNRPYQPQLGKAVLQPEPDRLPRTRAPGGSAGTPAIPSPGRRRENGWLIGTGVAASTYPVFVHSGRVRPRCGCRRERPLHRGDRRRPTSAPAPGRH